MPSCPTVGFQVHISVTPTQDSDPAAHKRHTVLSNAPWSTKGIPNPPLHYDPKTLDKPPGLYPNISHDMGEQSKVEYQQVIKKHCCR
jgi:hypothetical protein